MTTEFSDSDRAHMRRAIQLALEAEAQGNLPIGCVISYDGQQVAEGKNAIWAPEFNPIRHAEIEALLAVPRELWEQSRKITLYTTLEPCIMCAAAILQHGVGRVCFGSTDEYGGAGYMFGHMSPYFEEEIHKLEWSGPVMPEACDAHNQRALEAVLNRGSSLD